MNGIRYHRRKNGLNICVLSKRTGLSPNTLALIENTTSETGYSRITPAPYIPLSDYFGVPISLLIRDDYPEIPEPERSINIDANSESGNNPLVIFRHKNNLSYRKLSTILGMSHESVRQICMTSEIPEKYASAVNELICGNGA